MAGVFCVATQAEYTPPVIYRQEERSKMVVMAEAWPQPADAPRLTVVVTREHRVPPRLVETRSLLPEKSP